MTGRRMTFVMQAGGGPARSPFRSTTEQIFGVFERHVTVRRSDRAGSGQSAKTEPKVEGEAKKKLAGT